LAATTHLENERSLKMLWAVTAAGLIVSILSALENRVPWIASFCAIFGDGCRRTQEFTLFNIQVSWWGIAYYLLLACFLALAEPWLFWVAMLGVGFELTFLRIMVSMRLFCIFCLFNALVIVVLAWMVFDPQRMWPGATLMLLVYLGSNYFLSKENMPQTDALPEQSLQTVVAEVDGRTITREELERPLSQRIYQQKNKIYQIKRSHLDQMVQEILLQKEAERRGVEKPRLLEDLIAEAPGVSDDAVERYCRNHPKDMQRWQGSEEAFKKQVRQRLLEANAQATIRRFATSLRERYSVNIRLQKPFLPLTPVEIEGRPALGPADAPVVVVEFSDLFCPACRRAHETVHKIRAAYKDRIRLVFKDFPLERHKGAKLAAEAAHCAEAQGKYWEYQDRVFKAEEKPDRAMLEKYAEQLGLDRSAFEDCLDSGRYRSQVEEDIQAGRNIGMSATPTFIINGKMFSGSLSYDEFKQEIDAALREALQPAVKT
jgi:protein-disulfide isomerase